MSEEHEITVLAYDHEGKVSSFRLIDGRGYPYTIEQLVRIIAQALQPEKDQAQPEPPQDMPYIGRWPGSIE